MTGQAEDNDAIFSADLLARHAYIDEMATSILSGSVAQINALGITARAELSEDRFTAVFRASAPSDLDDSLRPWALRLADFLFNARAALDNVMWLIAHDSPNEALTEAEEKSLYFPIAATEHEWKSFAGSPAAKKVRGPLLARLESVQPFRRPDEPTSQGLIVMNKLHREDKHRLPLGLELMLDFQMPTLYDVQPETGGAFESRQEWLEYSEPVVDGLPIMRVRLDKPALPPPDLDLNVVPMASLNGERYDLQDLVWDVQGAVTRSIDTICLGVTFRADIFDAEVAWRRESLKALHRSMAEGTDEWERRGFSRPSPYGAVMEEMNKEHPDLSILSEMGLLADEEPS